MEQGKVASTYDRTGSCHSIQQMQYKTAHPQGSIRRVVTVSALVAACTVGCVATPVTPGRAQTRPPSPMDYALKDAAHLTGIAASKLKVTASERVTWLDGSLGCPDPALMYTQELVPGFRIRIEAGSRMLDYHADVRGTLILCPPERAAPMPKRDSAPYRQGGH